MADDRVVAEQVIERGAIRQAPLDDVANPVDRTLHAFRLLILVPKNVRWSPCQYPAPRP